MEGEAFWEEEKTGRGTEKNRDAGRGTNKFTIYDIRFTIERLQAVITLNHLTINTLHLTEEFFYFFCYFCRKGANHEIIYSNYRKMP